jgi:Sec-independent protein secretion pathway component TatC
MSTLSLCYFRNIPSPLRRPCPQGPINYFLPMLPPFCILFVFGLSFAFYLVVLSTDAFPPLQAWWSSDTTKTMMGFSAHGSFLCYQLSLFASLEAVPLVSSGCSIETLLLVVIGLFWNSGGVGPI